MKDEMAIIADRWMLTSRQLVNWGSYDGYHEFRPSTDSGEPVTLLAGASESGKSTLVDAQISLLYPTGTPYNKASNAGRSERNDYTYLRGMLGMSNDGTGDVPIYLRGRDDDGMPQSVWGAIVDTYENRTGGEILSCAKFLYLSPGDGRGDVRRQYVVWDRKMDPRMMDAFRDAPFTPTALKSTYPGCLQFSNADAFHAHIWRTLGLSESACRLLYKIQSADAPSRLDDIFKQGVLGVPEALGLARSTVEDYDRYDENFRSMEEKARRVARLRGIQQAYGEYANVLRRSRAFEPVDPTGESGRRTLEHWVIGRLTEEVAAQLPDDEHEAELQRRETERLQRHADSLQHRIVDISARMQGVDGGGRIRLETELDQAGRDLDDARRQRERMETQFRGLDETMPADSSAWDARRRTALAFEQTYEDELAECERLRDEAVGDRSEAATDLARLRKDHERQSRRRTRITQAMDDARALLARATGLGVDELPYVAELMDVREDCERWRAAMNVAYAPIAQTILVDKRHERGFAEKVSAIDPTTMIRRTWRFVDTSREYDTGSNAGWMSDKLRYREDSPFVGWLKEQTGSERFDARCVDVIDDGDGDRQVQTDGQMKSGDRGYHGTKGLHPVIGFADDSYLERLAQSVNDAKARLQQADAAYAEQKRRIDRLHKEHGLAEQLDYTPWEKVDADGIRRRIDELKDVAARRDDQEPDGLAAMRDEIEAELAQENQKLYQAKTRYESLQRATAAIRRWLETHDDPDHEGHDGPQLPEPVVELLDSAYEDNFAGVVNRADRPHIIVGAGSATRGDAFERHVVERVSEAVRKRIAALAETAGTRRTETETRMATYLDLYAGDDGSLTASVEDYKYYLDELTDLERLTASAATEEEYANSLDKLLMNFTQINRALDTDANDIADQLDRINAMLRGQKFGPRHGSLSIGADVRRPERSFTARLKRTIAALGEWHAEAERSSDRMAVARKTFASCTGLVEALRRELEQVRDANGIKNYGARNLDPRCRSSFYATVRHADIPDERITSTGGKSGGALQELTSFVYGAALIYLLGGDVSGRPTYTTLFLDEALIKADGRYTQRALSVLPRLGFQVIVSAPESKTAEILEIATKAYVAYRDPGTGRSYLQEATLTAADAE
ncbi:hypothetical protein GFD17_09270 [Bifidobacterium sp. SMB2]|uniref:P-loop containing region of AAA domain-containing protein n=1 Tax=Bifidobacterium saimiriisciurei TaxID=2661627 RepID=A0ABX0C8Q7_9BIFI|nr:MULTISPECIES: ATP-binding protein [Bifidobacterium]NEG96937.1 hypothetical protein [Bifidobacterium sp. SMB2]NEH11533.1 hypothetical protein [Bifidobacterium saimiriisciurei]